MTFGDKIMQYMTKNVKSTICSQIANAFTIFNKSNIDVYSKIINKNINRESRLFYLIFKNVKLRKINSVVHQIHISAVGREKSTQKKKLS